MRAAAEVMQMSVRQFAMEAPILFARQIAEQIVTEQQAAAEQVVEELTGGETNDSGEVRQPEAEDGTTESNSTGTDS
jgi:hypothetical protein